MGQSARGSMKLGKIGFLNVLPIYYPLEQGIIRHPFTLVAGSPAELNRKMAEGELDVSAVSSIEYARHPERYLLVPDLSISSYGVVQSVVLLSRVPLEDLQGRSILVTEKSHTSVALLKVLLSRHFGISARFRNGTPSLALAAGENPVAMLAIGDEALHLQREAGYGYCLDLGAAWHEWTGLPFVFGVWVVQRAALRQWNGQLPDALHKLQAAKEWGRSHLDEICRHGAQQGLLNSDELRGYYQALHFDLRQAELSGLAAFFRCLEQIGEISTAPALEVYSPFACVA